MTSGPAPLVLTSQLVLFWNTVHLEELPFGQNPLLLFPIFLIMRLLPVAHLKPSGSSGSEERLGICGVNGSQVQAWLLSAGCSGGQPDGASRGFLHCSALRWRRVWKVVDMSLQLLVLTDRVFFYTRYPQ